MSFILIRFSTCDIANALCLLSSSCVTLLLSTILASAVAAATYIKHLKIGDKLTSLS